MNIINPGKTFTDIAGHKDKMCIEALASRGIITGKTEDRFEPDGTMTRAEFATVIVRLIGKENSEIINNKITFIYYIVCIYYWTFIF